MLDIIDVDQISSTIARDCSKLRELGGRTLSAETTTDAPRARAYFRLVALS